MQRKNINIVDKGYVRKLEVTYNLELVITDDLYYRQKEYWDNQGLRIGDLNPNLDTYHSHFHIIMAVNRSYFTNRTYINQSEWLELWRESKRDYNITQADVRKVKKSNDKSYLEITKYTSKKSDYLINQSVFDIFYKTLSGRRLIVFNQLLKRLII